MLYQLETAAIWASKARPSLVCEIIAPRRELVRQRSIASFNENDTLARQALAAYTETVLSESEWPSNEAADLSEDERLERASELLKQEFSYSVDGHPATVEALRSQFEQAAESSSTTTLAKFTCGTGVMLGWCPGEAPIVTATHQPTNS